MPMTGLSQRSGVKGAEMEVEYTQAMHALPSTVCTYLLSVLGRAGGSSISEFVNHKSKESLEHE